MKSINIKKRKVKAADLELKEKVVVINRVAKVVKGGRRFSFSALAVVGDGNGNIGIGFGKANEVPDAIRKSIEDGKKNIFKVRLNKNTIPHEVIGKFKSTRVMLKPATQGTGLIAGNNVRSVVESAGVSDILSKCYGSRNPINVVKATLDGLLRLKDLKTISGIREIPVSKIWEA
jgi:small subunit ribosomal protein S5